MSETPGMLETFDIMRLMQLLPHRYPFLLIDRIVDVDGDNSAVGIKNVTANEPQFQGHFPQKPVLPGVLIVEAMAQVCGAICVAHVNAEPAPLVYFMTIDNAKFRRPVEPGDRLEIPVRKLKQRDNIWRFACEARVGDQKVAEAEISAMMMLENSGQRA